MKYLITESQLGNIIYKYLDNLNLHKVKDRDDYYFWKSEEAWDRGDYLTISATRKRKDCFVSSVLVMEISSFFSLDLETALSVIVKWVETKIDFEIIYPYSDYGAD